MRTMKNSGVEWIGEIPSDWEIRKLGDITKKITDYVASGSFASLNENVEYLDEPNYAMLIRTVDLSGGKNIKPVYISNSAYDFLSNSNLFGGEIILSNIGSVGSVFIYKPIYKNASLAPNAIMLIMNESNRYYYYWFQNPLVNAALKQIGSNAIQCKFNKTQLRAFLVAHPNMKTQQRIADFLDKKCGKIDEIIEREQVVIEKLKEYKQSVITEAVTKGLNPNAEMKDSGIEWIGKIPKDWEVAPLFTIFNKGQNKNKQETEHNLLSLSYGKIIKKNINTKEGLLPEKFSSYNIVEVNDIIIRPTDLQNDKHSLRTGLVREHGIITSAYIDLRPIRTINSEFYHYLLHVYDIMKVFYNMGNGVRQGLNYDTFSRLLVFSPSPTEQTQIADYLDKKCAKIDKTIEAKQAVIEKLTEYKKSLIYEVVTGKKEI